MKKKKETVLSVLKDIRDFLKPQAAKPMGDDRFTRNSDGTITDKKFNLVWYPTLPKRIPWEEAKKECEKIGCRLPTVEELTSLVDYTTHEPAINKEIFPDTKTDDYYWTATPCPWSSDAAWLVSFDVGNVYNYNKGSSNCVRPVRTSK